MYTPMPIKGHHGTSSIDAECIIDEQEFFLSRNNYEWLGDGVYFFQDAPLRAWHWAMNWKCREKKGKPKLTPNVISADISLENCFDLLDIKNWIYISRAYELFIIDDDGSTEQKSPIVRKADKSRYEIFNPDPTKDYNGVNTVDCAVIKIAIALFKKATGTDVYSVRAAFVEGKQLYNNSHFFDRNHVQIAVLNTGVISNIYIEDSTIIEKIYKISGDHHFLF